MTVLTHQWSGPACGVAENVGGGARGRAVFQTPSTWSQSQEALWEPSSPLLEPPFLHKTIGQSCACLCIVKASLIWTWLLTYYRGRHKIVNVNNTMYVQSATWTFMYSVCVTQKEVVWETGWDGEGWNEINIAFQCVCYSMYKVTWLHFKSRQCWPTVAYLIVCVHEGHYEGSHKVHQLMDGCPLPQYSLSTLISFK